MLDDFKVIGQLKIGCAHIQPDSNNFSAQHTSPSTPAYLFSFLPFHSQVEILMRTGCLINHLVPPCFFQSSDCQILRFMRIIKFRGMSGQR